MTVEHLLPIGRKEREDDPGSFHAASETSTRTASVAREHPTLRFRVTRRQGQILVRNRSNERKVAIPPDFVRLAVLV
jgi:hypothetical protein